MECTVVLQEPHNNEASGESGFAGVVGCSRGVDSQQCDANEANAVTIGRAKPKSKIYNSTVAISGFIDSTLACLFCWASINPTQSARTSQPSFGVPP